MRKIFLLVILTSICHGWRTLDSASSVSSKTSCETPKPLFSNGLITPKRRGRLLIYECLRGYRLVGSRFTRCINGKYDDHPPTCAKRGCDLPPRPENSILLTEYHQAVIRLDCNEGYVVAGPKLSICLGRNWTVPLGTCRETNVLQTSCDFESEDLCGWVHDDDADFNWKRLTRTTNNTYRTGPRHDHTTSKVGHGYFMLVESKGQELNNRARLISPVFKAEHSVGGCVRLWYFMYGAAVETLAIHYKTESTKMDSIIESTNYVIWNASRESFDGWKEAYVHLPQVEENFQIIVEAFSSGNHLGDIAIDDLEIISCPKDSTESTTEFEASSTETNEILVNDYESCTDRCNETISKKVLHSLIYRSTEVCDCHERCTLLNSCCPDYESKCLEDTSTAIDDFEMIRSPKDSQKSITEFEPPSTETNEILVNDYESCTDRCNETISKKVLHSLIYRSTEVCDCHERCTLLDSCCPDYESKCLEDTSTAIDDFEMIRSPKDSQKSITEF